MERIVNTVLQELDTAGVRAIRGYDGSQLPVLNAPLAAVSIADAVYFPVCADSLISENILYRSTGLRAEATLLIQIYDDYRHGDQACVETAIQAASICSSLTGSFTCGKIQLSCVHYEADYDCFCCNVRIPVRVYIARRDQVS